MKLEDFSLQRFGQSYVKSRGKNGRKEYGYKEIYRTCIGDFSTEEWRKTVLKAIDDAGENDLLEEIKQHCRSHCAWLHKEEDIEEYSMECLVDRAYRHWKDFKGGTEMSEELSLVISNPNDGEFLKEIEWNKKEFMELVASITQQYEGLTYTEDQVKEAKSDRAKLNAMKKAISNRRIQVKKAVMEPYTKFEAEVAEVTALIDEPIAMIDMQIKEYEERVKSEKKEALQEYFNEIASDLEGILAFDMVFDPRYLNVSVSLNKAKADIQTKVERVRTDIVSLENFCEDKYLTIAKDKYIRTLNVSDALAEVKRLQEFDRKAEEERLRREEEERIRREKEAEEARIAAETKDAEDKIGESVTKTEENVIEPSENGAEQKKSVENDTENDTDQAEIVHPTTAPIDTPDASMCKKKTPDEDDKLCKASFTVYGTKSQIMDLREYMAQHNIKFGKVEK